MSANSRSEPKIGVVVVAYNAASTLAGVLDRIPPSMRARISEVIVSDDSSSDATYLVGLGYKQLCRDLPLTVIRNERNLGYGGNQKACYRLAIEHGLDIVVLLHGDGQYAPEYLPHMIAPLERGDCDAVFGSRMLEPGAARRGGMPLYKYVGNKILTRIENSLLGTDLSEFHSGYRAYSVHALAELDLSSTSDGFDFDTEIIIMLHDRRMSIVEIPIPTYYGDEICYVNGLSYARDVLLDVARYRATRTLSGVGRPTPTAKTATRRREVVLTHSPWSSHGRILASLANRPPLRVLDVGCATGALAEAIEALGHTVTGTDAGSFADAEQRMHRFVPGDLDLGLPEEAGRDFDVVVAGDVLEHLKDPELVLAQIRDCLAEDGKALVSVPSFTHWYPRLRVALGKFDYDNQGILDRGHIRFFTRRSFEQMARRLGLRVNRIEPVGLPIERLTESTSPLISSLSHVDRLAATYYPSLCAYQYLFELVRVPEPDVRTVAASSRAASRQLPSPDLATDQGTPRALVR